MIEVVPNWTIAVRPMQLYLFLWQFKLATWLRVYNYVKNKHVRAETVAYLEVVSNK